MHQSASVNSCDTVEKLLNEVLTLSVLSFKECMLRGSTGVST